MKNTKKPKRLNKRNITNLLIKLQNDGNFEANVIATQAVKDFGLEEMHKQLAK